MARNRIQTSPAFRAGQPHALFALGNVPWDAAPDGKRFLVVKEPETAAGEAKLQVVVNWFEEPRQKATGGSSETGPISAITKRRVP